MNRRILAASLAAAGTAVTALASAGPAAADSAIVAPCTPIQLPGLPGGDGSGEVMWINDSGLAVGGADTGTVNAYGPVFAATYWTNDGSGYQIHTLPNDPLVNDEVLDVNQHAQMVDYGFDPMTAESATYVYDLPTNTWYRLARLGPDTRGRRINEAGVVAGGGSDRNGDSFAATWAPPYTKLNKLPDNGLDSYASGINDLGVTVGANGRGRVTPAIDPTLRHSGPHGYYPQRRAIQWAPNGSPSTLPSLGSGAAGFAVNDAGTVVGATLTPSGDIHSAYWVNGAVHDMGGTPNAFTEARGLSQGGWATGDSEDFDTPAAHAFVWTGAGTLQYLAALDGPGGSSNTHAVNDQLRQVGGWSDTGTGGSAPAIWQCPVGFTTG